MKRIALQVVLPRGNILFPPSQGRFMAHVLSGAQASVSHGSAARYRLLAGNAGQELGSGKQSMGRVLSSTTQGSSPPDRQPALLNLGLDYVFRNVAGNA